ncbi:thiol reductant ABC exporter subunit CydD [Aggregatilinea lenta]|uniref:thiol reductant ABC exporter subunit CydD n=1 Tax=Aggregatilinea lenta TaxID=913108 RepID=UPI000E5BA327|nr:thiol reductant ABC exporter subunit CydD [Aggregatilinea lenta]
MNIDKRLLALIAPVRRLLIVSTVLSFIAGLLLIFQAYALSHTISQAFLEGASLSGVQTWLIALLLIVIGRAVTLGLSEIAAQRFTGRIKTGLREHFYAHLVALGPAYTRGERTGELSATALAGIEALDAYFREYLPQLFLALLIPFSILLFVFPTDVLSGVVMLLTAPLIPFFMALIGIVSAVRAKKAYAALIRLSAHFLDVLQGLTTLKLFGRSREESTVVSEMSDRFRETTMDVLRVAFLSALALELISTISVAIIAVEIGLRLLYGNLSFERAFFVLILAPEFYLPLRLLGTRFHAGMDGVAAAQRIFAVLETPVPDVPEAVQPVPTGDFSVTFEDVQFTYEDGGRHALNGVRFTVPARHSVALVGPTGGGKSTLVQLLLRFTAPTGGRITVNGMPLDVFDADEWRRQIAWVPQLPYLFNATVADNIRLARPDAPQDDVIRAARQAHADAFIDALPQGYDTPIGERGSRLSGGQAQRIALARAFLKDAPLLILDEATSSLDPETETLLQDAIETLMRDRTVLIVAHRLSTIYRADQIVVIEGGQVVEAGRHEALLAHAGVYHDLVRAYGEGKPSAVSGQ